MNSNEHDLLLTLANASPVMGGTDTVSAGNSSPNKSNKLYSTACKSTKLSVIGMPLIVTVLRTISSARIRDFASASAACVASDSCTSGGMRMME